MPGRRLLREDIHSAELLTRTVDQHTGDDRFLLTKARRLPSDGDIELALNVVEDLTAVMRAARHQRILAEAGDAMAAAPDQDATLRAVAEVVIGDFAEACIIDLLDRDGSIAAAAVAHADPAKLALGRELRSRYPIDPAGIDIAAVVMRGAPAIMARAPGDPQLSALAREALQLDLMRQLEIGAVIVAPIDADGRRVGTITIVARGDGRRFSQQDRELAAELGRRAGLAIASARAHAARAEIAHELQQGLLPRDPPPIAGLDVACAFAPVGETAEMGGDFYEVFHVGDDWIAVIGDVVGKGPAAAAVTGLARHTIHAVCQLTDDPLAAVAALDARLQDDHRGALCSVLIVHGRAGSELVDVVCAGHPPGLVVRAGTVEAVGEPGPLPGALPGPSWTAVPVTLSSGDALAIYTDGVTEAVGEGNERFGAARLAAALAPGGSAQEMVDRVRDELDRFSSGVLRDDVAMLVMHRT